MEGTSGVAFLCGLVVVSLLSAFVGGFLLRRLIEKVFNVTLVPSGKRNFRVEGAAGNKGCFIGLLYVALNIGLFIMLFFAMIELIQ